MAWQLPNSYIGAHPQWPKERQKPISRELKETLLAPAQNPERAYELWQQLGDGGC